MFFTSYLENVLSTRRLIETTQKAIEVLDKHKDNFDSFAFIGNSGALVAPVLAMNMNKGMIMVRKGRHHSQYAVEGVQSYFSYVIVDDLIYTGKSVKKIINEIKHQTKSYPKQPTCYGAYLYNVSIHHLKCAVDVCKKLGIKHII